MKNEYEFRQNVMKAAGVKPVGFGPHVYYSVDGREPISYCANCKKRYDNSETKLLDNGWKVTWGQCKKGKETAQYPDPLTPKGFCALLEALVAKGLLVRTTHFPSKFVVVRILKMGKDELKASSNDENGNHFNALLKAAAQTLGVKHE